MPARAWASLLVGSATVVLIILDAGFVALAFPDIEAHFADASRATLGWVFSGYFIALAAFMLLAGWLGDRTGRRRVFFAGLGLFALGAVLTASAPNPGLLIGARVVQGIGAAALTPVSLAMVLPAFPDDRRSIAVGAWGVAGALAGIVSPTLGAGLIETAGWRAPFLFFAPLALLTWLVGRRVLPDQAPEDPSGSVDGWGIVLTTAAVGALAVVVTQGDEWGWWTTATLSFAVVAVVSGWAVLQRARTRPGSLLDLALFRVRSYASANVVSVLSQAGFFSFFFSLPLFLIDVWGWTTFEAGMAVALNQISAAVVGIPAGRRADQRGPVGVVAVGGVVAAVGYGWLALGTGADPAVGAVLVPALVLGGVGSMMIGSTISAAAFRDLDDAMLGRAAGSYYVTRRLGSAAGAVAAVAILGDQTGFDAVDRFRWIWGFTTVCYLAAGVVMWRAYEARVLRIR